MKLSLYLAFFLLALFLSDDKTLSLTDSQIKAICKKEKRELTCIKKLKEKKYQLLRGNLIEIPTIPYKR